MKKNIQIMVVGIALLGATGCGSQAVKPVENSVVTAPVVMDQKSGVEAPKKDEIKMIPYTSKNGVVQFSYPEISYEPGQTLEVKHKVIVEEKGNYVYVFLDGYPTLKPEEKSLYTFLSKANIEQKDVDAFVKKEIKDRDCNVTFTADPTDANLLYVSTNFILSDDKKDCTALPDGGVYDVKNKRLMMIQKGGDFFFDGDETDEQDGSTKSLGEKFLDTVHFVGVFPITYTNEKYGFVLSLPESWKGYTVTPRELSWGDYGTSDSIDFGFGEQNPILNVAVHTKEQWKKINADQEKDSVHTVMYLGENKKYVFSYATTGDVANNEMSQRLTEVRSFITTFQVQ